MNFKNTVDKNMAKLWTGALKTTLQDLLYERSIGGGIYDPVSEVTTGGTVLAETLKVLPRDISKDAGKDDTLYVTDVKLTVRVVDFYPIFDKPKTSDNLTYKGVKYRLEKYSGDVTDTFFHLFLRGI